MELQNQLALVTGGATGLGKAISLELARRGANVAIVYSRSESDAISTSDEVRSLGVRCETFQCDVSHGTSVRALVPKVLESFGHLDILINDAGTTKFVPFPDLEGVTDEDWDRIMSVNVKGPWMLARAAASALAEQNGSIVNIASVAGIRPGGSSLTYCVSKAALIHLTSCLAVAMAPKVRVNCIAPGLFLTRWTAGFPEERIQGMIDRTPLKQTVSVEDLARATVDLACNRSITGSIHVVDSGIQLV